MINNTNNMTRLDKVWPAPLGTRCYYENEALKLSGWGILVEPLDAIDAMEIPHLLPWRGTLIGPVNGGQVMLNMLAPGCGILPGEDVYCILPQICLWVNEKESS